MKYELGQGKSYACSCARLVEERVYKRMKSREKSLESITNVLLNYYRHYVVAQVSLCAYNAQMCC